MKPKIAICLTGGSFSRQWVLGLLDLVMQMIANGFPTIIISIAGSNIFDVRNSCVATLADSGMDPDYVFWIDYDNPPSFENFANLLKHQVDFVAGWSWLQVDENNKGKTVASYGDWNEKTQWYKAEVPEQATLLGKDGTLHYRHYTGFGCVLMKGDMLDSLGTSPFSPLLDGKLYPDDVVFCRRAIAKGYKILIDSSVFVEHLKLQGIGPTLKVENLKRKETDSGNCSNGSNQQSSLQELEHNLC